MTDPLKAKVADILGAAAGAAEANPQMDDRDFLANMLDRRRELLEFVEAVSLGHPTLKAAILEQSPAMLPMGVFIRLTGLLEKVRFDD